jgi:hypothetical protein
MNFDVIRITFNVDRNLVALINYKVTASGNASDAVASVILAPAISGIKDFVG